MAQMELQIDRNAIEPIYVQIATQFRARIKSRLWPAGYRLRAEDEIAADLGVARGTLRRAVLDLVTEGLLVQVQGRGTFVTGGSAAAGATLASTSSGGDLQREGVEFHTSVVTKGIRRVPAKGSFPGGQALTLRRLRSLAEGPDAVLDTQILLDAVDGLADLTTSELEVGPLYELFESKFGLRFSAAERFYIAACPSGEIAELLDLPNTQPVLEFEQFNFLDGAGCIEYSHIWLRTDRHPHAITL